MAHFERVAWIRFISVLFIASHVTMYVAETTAEELTFWLAAVALAFNYAMERYGK